jgi:DNA-binding beta-propeller fold protein YncE
VRRLILLLSLGACQVDTRTLRAPPNLDPPGEDLSVADQSEKELWQPFADLQMPDQQMPDQQMSDQQMPDLQMPDLQEPDLQTPDLLQPDLTSNDVVHFLHGVQVTTFAGSATKGAQDGVGGTVQFDNPTGVALDQFGNLYVVEYDGARVRRLDLSGASATVLVGQPGFHGPFGIAIAGYDVYLETDFNQAGVKNDTSGTLWLWHIYGGPATVAVAGLGRPRGLSALADGSIFLPDRTRATVSYLVPAPTPSPTPIAGLDGFPGYIDDVGSAARFADPYGSAPLPDGSVLVADDLNHVIRQVWLDGTVTTFAGDGGDGTVDGPRLSARFRLPKAVSTDSHGTVYISDPGAHRVRRIRCADGVVETLAGDGVAGFADGTGDQAEFFGQEGLVASPDGTFLYLSDGNNGEAQPYNRVRKLTLP